jgi:hypothetical protein
VPLKTQRDGGVPLENEDPLIFEAPIEEKHVVKSLDTPGDIVCLPYSRKQSNFSRHSSLPDISANINETTPVSTKELEEDMKAIFGEKQNDSEYSAYEICENNDEDAGARAKSLHSDLSDKSKSSTESSSASPSNEEIWHLGDGGVEHELKHRLKSDDPNSAHVTESDSCGNDTEKGAYSHSNPDRFSFWEAQRAYLESRIGIQTLVKVYRLVADLEQKSVDGKLDYSDFQKILGRGNEDLIDNIIQLVVADNFFNVDQ